MVTVFASLALASALAVPPTTPPVSGPIAHAAAASFKAASTMPRRGAALQSNGRDSLRNGGIIGAAVGGLLGAFGGSAGCAAGSILDYSEKETDCTGPVFVGAIAGAAIGALIGTGVDALFERAPYLGPGTGGTRRGIRVRWRF